jgi:hypothetical protein
LPETDPWRRCAQTEEWLATPAELPPQKALGDCRFAPQRPHLDAKLDEDFWESADRLRLKSGSDAPADTPSGDVRLACDKDYLYIAIRCNRAAACEYESDDRPRQRDADLASHDRVTLQLDTNRDFTTSFELSVDSRGWTHDACWGDATWNPTWYVAAAVDEEAWIAEAAVPWKELIQEPPTSRAVWAVAIRRTIPGVGSQSWSDTSDPESPDQFGLLIFE